ncbi:MAG TPA: response regulator transcription factor [Vicinamibacterales bacterium]|nr:response regulator transcription factor [Vicinamibacterales bacterium]
MLDIDGRRWRALVAEPDQPVARRARQLLEAAGFAGLGPAHTVEEAAGLIVLSRPDVVVMDLALSPDVEADRAVALLAYDMGIPVVCTSRSPDRAMVERAAEIHAAGYVVKPFADHQLESAVLLAVLTAAPAVLPISARRLSSAEKLRVIASVLDDASASADDATTTAAAVAPTSASMLAKGLTRREREIVDLLASGARVAGIASRLGLSAHTIRNHLKSIFRKLEVRGQHELFEYWARLGVAAASAGGQTAAYPVRGTTRKSP